MACRDSWEVEFSCPFEDCEEEITATFEPGSSGSRDEPPYGPQMIGLEGCSHALAYENGTLDPADVLRMDSAIDAAAEEDSRRAQDDAEGAAEAAWEAKEDR